MSADLLVLDLDGVVVDAAMRIDPVLEAGVRHAGARGLRITVATGRGVSKGEALKVLVRRLGISLGRVIAVGDQENDIEMIKTAGIGVAMSHSPPHVRAAARHVAPPPEAGGLPALLASLCPEHFAS